MGKRVLKQIPQMDTSIPMVIQLLFLVLICCGLQPADGCLDNTITLEDKFTGQLKFCKRSWGAVCSLDSDHFTGVDSQVVCYELGYSGDGANFTIGNNNIPRNYIALTHVHCRGDEERLSECQHGKFKDDERNECEHTDESVYVTCSKESQVRLHNYQDDKLQDYRGVVEHWYNGSWHVLCDTGEWTLNDSQVVCQQLGLGNAVELGPFKADDGSLAYLQNSIDCRNNEYMIRECRGEDAWAVTFTCNGNLTSARCKGPVVQDITITSPTSESVTLSWEFPQNFNKAVVTTFRVEYWPEGHQSQKRCFDQSSNFSNATLDFLKPDTMYEMVIVPMMGEHPGPDSTTHRVKTRKRPVDAAIIVLSCALAAVSCILIAILFVAIIRCIMIRRRHGYGNIQNENGGCCYRARAASNMVVRLPPIPL